MNKPYLAYKLLHKALFYVIIFKRSRCRTYYIASGEVAKWLNAADCKSALYEFDSSNLPLSTTSWGVAKW